jgi:hypothetical protein
MPIIYSAAQLINEAFYTSEIVSRGFQNVAAEQAETGLIKLNEIITESAIMDDMLPYYTTQYNFYGIPGQQQYFIPNLVKLETLVFYINGVIRYFMEKVSQDYQFGAARVENINSLPYTYHYERAYQLITPTPEPITNMVSQANIGTSVVVNNSTIIITDGNITPLSSVTATMLSSSNGVFVTSASAGSGTLTVVCNGIPGAVWSLSYSSTTPVSTIVNQTSANVNTNVATLTIVDPTVETTSTVTATMVSSTNNVSVTSVTKGFNTLTVDLTAAPGALWTLSYTVITPRWTPGSNIFVYFFPDQAYQFMATGLFQLPPLTSIYDDLGTMFDSYYITYLQYRLAERLCIAYSFNFPPQAQKLLSEYQMAVSKRSAPMDLTLRKLTTLGNSQSINYAMANFHSGWI